MQHCPPKMLHLAIERAQIKDRPVLPVIEEYGMRTSGKDGRTHVRPRADRKHIDDIVFDEMRLTRGERDAVYEAVINMVQTRLAKAESLKPTERKKRIEAASKTLGIWADVPAGTDDEDQEE